MAYEPGKHGRAEYGSWMQIDKDLADAITSIEGADASNYTLKEQKFANLVYVVNSADMGGGSGSGGITDLQIAQLTTAISNQTTAITNDIDNTPVVNALDTQTNALSPGLTELYIENTYSRVIQTDGTDTYIGQAERGHQLTDLVWRVQKIDVNGSRSWAGTGIFDQPADNMAGLTNYNY